MGIRTRIATGTATAAAGIAAVLLSPGAAFAGTNGQQIEFFDNIGDTNSVVVSGTNQNGQSVSHCFDTTGPDTRFYGWWWADTTTLDEYEGPCGSGSTRLRTQIIAVPRTQPDSDGDWWQVNNYID
ncbi:hypothetical protein AV521_34000 [Streptomyces sp. IMTB 2501]|uniref:hypothetical protein n=1 Tax=Streptomyces sp. IMTB 2501 TaxID=1776340 RepID=UPI00096F2DF5|nr:hypothetical protein [Streptomyces sp. IMTB 2501]OLZ64967.1 hypothetical protein AV521_34000 [Streptomyces sp. IMTB 2501]